jgi:hypothetical protein
MQPRHLLVTAVAIHAVAILAGGALLGTADGVGYAAGLWLSLNIVTTIGFGPGPTSTAGQLLVPLVFAMGVTGWWMFLMAAFGTARGGKATGSRGQRVDPVRLGHHRPHDN